MKKLWLVTFILLQIIIGWQIYDTTKDLSFENFNLSSLINGNFGNINLSNVKHREPLIESFDGATTVRLQGFIGDIEIVYSDVPSITFDGEKVLSHTSVDMDAFNNTYIEYRREGDSVVVLNWVKPRTFAGTVGFTGKVIIPTTVQSLNVGVQLGKVTSIGGNNDLSINANLGDVRVEDHVGSVNIDADLGAVRLTNIKPTDSLRITADLGEVTYRGSLARHSEIRAALGSIKLTLPADTYTNIDASVDLGTIDSDFPLTSYSRTGTRTRIVGTLGNVTSEEPKGNLVLRADLGSIDIRRAAMW